MYHHVDQAPDPGSTHTDVRPGDMLRARPWLWGLAFGLAASQLVLLGVYLTEGLGAEDGWGKLQVADRAEAIVRAREAGMGQTSGSTGT